MVKERAIRVLCVDDNPMIGEAVAVKLQQVDGYEVLGQLMNADELVAKAKEARPDVILLDIDMPGKDPFVAMEELAEAMPETRVIMLSGHVRRDLIDRAFESGAWGYLSKNNDVQMLPDAIAQVAGGGVAIGPDVQSLID